MPWVVHQIAAEPPMSEPMIVVIHASPGDADDNMTARKRARSWMA